MSDIKYWNQISIKYQLRGFSHFNVGGKGLRMCLNKQISVVPFTKPFQGRNIIIVPFLRLTQCFKSKEQVPLLPLFTCWHVNRVAGISKWSSNSLSSEFSHWINDRLLEDNPDCYKSNLLNKQSLLLVFCLGIWVYIFDCQRAVSSSESVVVCFLTPTSVYFLFPCFSLFIQHCCDLLWNAAVGVDERRNTKQTHSGAILERTRSLNPGVSTLMKH